MFFLWLSEGPMTTQANVAHRTVVPYTLDAVSIWQQMLSAVHYSLPTANGEPHSVQYCACQILEIIQLLKGYTNLKHLSLE